MINKKPIYIGFHYNSGFTPPSINRKYVERLVRYLQDKYPEERFWASHLKINPETPEDEAICMCLDKIPQCKALWMYRITMGGQEMFPMSDNMIVEISLADSEGIPIEIHDTFPQTIQSDIELLCASNVEIADMAKLRKAEREAVADNYSQRE